MLHPPVYITQDQCTIFSYHTYIPYHYSLQSVIIHKYVCIYISIHSITKVSVTIPFKSFETSPIFLMSMLAKKLCSLYISCDWRKMEGCPLVGWSKSSSLGQGCRRRRNQLDKHLPAAPSPCMCLSYRMCCIHSFYQCLYISLITNASCRATSTILSRFFQ